MIRNSKKTLLITILTCVLVLFGCKNISFGTYDAAKDAKNDNDYRQAVTENKENTKPDNSGKDSNNPDSLMNTVEQQGGEKDPTPTLIQPAANTELAIYTVTKEAEVAPATAMIPVDTEITPQLIVDIVKDAIAENSLMVGIESVTTKKDAVIVSFYSDQPPLAEVGAGFETAILDAIAQSLTDNLEDYSKIIYRVEGKAYVSGHLELGIDEVYLSD